MNLQNDLTETRKSLELFKMSTEPLDRIETKLKDFGVLAEREEVETTQRGFEVWGEFVDTKGSKIRIQQSSAAAECCCWIFATDRDGNDATIHLGKPQAVSPHFNKDGARQLIAALTRFIEEGA